MNEIVKEYAMGLYALAAEEGICEEILAETDFLSPLIEGEYTRLLMNPNIPLSERVGLVDELLSGKVHKYTENFVKLMTSRGYSAYIPEAFAEYRRIWREENGIITAMAESAFPLSEEQKKQLEQKLSERTGRRVEVKFSIDPSLIGGVKLSYNNKLIDDTVRERLDSVAKRLSETTI